MVKLLKNTPALKAFIVGHTDNVGAVDMNVRLSAAGPFSPVAANREERGRAQNRRVALVEQ